MCLLAANFEIEKFSSQYIVRTLTPEDVEAIYGLSAGNPLFFEHCPPFVTRQSILEDMAALPPGKTYDDKFYVGFFDKGQLVAILDLILGYPEADTAFIGLFMVDRARQGGGLGSAIISQFASYLKTLGFARLRLAYAKGNPQSEAFWRKNGFQKTGEESRRETYTAVSMERRLN